MFLQWKHLIKNELYSVFWPSGQFSSQTKLFILRQGLFSSKTTGMGTQQIKTALSRWFWFQRTSKKEKKNLSFRFYQNILLRQSSKSLGKAAVCKSIHHFSHKGKLNKEKKNCAKLIYLKGKQMPDFILPFKVHRSRWKNPKLTLCFTAIFKIV